MLTPESDFINHPNPSIVFKALCVPETCPEGFRLVSNQPSSAHCYMYHAHEKGWEEALDSCASTDGAYLWRPNTEQEGIAVYNEYRITYPFITWTSANDRDNDGIFTFSNDNGLLSFDDLPFGEDISDDGVCVNIVNIGSSWGWKKSPCTTVLPYMCEYKLVHRVCP
ncbi:Hypothetical predicted protein [Mytilus galloprovincialis]|uniref:C-type lectin domain-containing protein n=1 Tax=Mytilus galloprovincialis TaxID=29158 RepID=A0A8B6BZ71_MYTGA|nr:Hypothetical predicted protein [Mytilus galloprovincialis]